LRAPHPYRYDTAAVATLAWFAVALLLPLISLPPSEPPISTRQARQPRSYAALLDEYVHGDADAAVAELAEWDASRLLAQATPPGTSRAQRDRYLQAAAMIHLEAILKGAPLDGHVPMARAAISR
jgi:hypothetical protein